MITSFFPSVARNKRKKIDSRSIDGKNKTIILSIKNACTELHGRAPLGQAHPNISRNNRSDDERSPHQKAERASCSGRAISTSTKGAASATATEVSIEGSSIRTHEDDQPSRKRLTGRGQRRTGRDGPASHQTGATGWGGRSSSQGRTRDRRRGEAVCRSRRVENTDPAQKGESCVKTGASLYTDDSSLGSVVASMEDSAQRGFLAVGGGDSLSTNDVGGRKPAPVTATVDNVGSKRPEAAEVEYNQATRTRLPVVGDRCRVYFDDGEDFFGFRLGAGGWYPATILRKIMGKETKYLVRYDNGEHEKIPPDFFELLFPGTNETDCHLVYTETGEIFYESNPSKLRTGDLVLGLWRRCLEANKQHTWWRGRVANTGCNENGDMICDIAYEDGDYERNIPYGRDHENILKLEDGHENPTWLKGLSVPIKYKNVPFGCVKEVSKGGPVLLEYTKGKGEASEKFQKKQAYRGVVGKLFDAMLQNKADQIRVYDWESRGVFTVDGVVWQMGDQVVQSGTTAKRGARVGAKKASTKGQKRVKKVMAKKPHVVEDDSQSAAQVGRGTRKPATKRRKARKLDQPEETAEPRPKRTRTAKAAAVKAEEPFPPTTDMAKEPSRRSAGENKLRTKTQSMEGDSLMVTAVEESDYVSDDPKDEAKPVSMVKRPKGIHYSLGVSLGQALNSWNSRFGADFLTFVTMFHDQVPNEDLCEILIRLTMYGPEKNRVRFPDCHRMEVAREYINRVLPKPGMKEVFASLAGPSYWENCFNQMYDLYYMAPSGDESRTDKAAIERIGQSIFAKFCCAELFLSLLCHCLDGYVRGNDSDNFCKEPIIKDIIRAGPKVAFKKALKACAHLWIMHGHFILVDLPGITCSGEGPATEAVQFIQVHLRNLLKTMGKVCSYFAWVYGTAAHENARDLSRLIGDELNKSYNNSSFDPSPLMGEVPLEELKKRIKFRFLLNFDKRIVPKLRPALAEALEVASRWNLVFGT